MRMSWDSSERVVILAVGIHSVVLGVALLIRPLWLLALLGWDGLEGSFFPAQSGLFLVLLGSGYLAAAWVRAYIWLLLGSKVGAVVFLVCAYALGAAPPIVLLSAALDGAMAVAVVVTGRASGRLRWGDQDVGSTSHTATAR